ncbi:glutamate--tRNA ligase [Savitreella phatthalungensis]
MGAIADQVKLTLALKAKPFAYGPLFIASAVNASSTVRLVEPSFKDADLISEKEAGSTASLTGTEKQQTQVQAIIEELVKVYPDVLAGRNQALTNEWLAFAADRLSGDFKKVQPALVELDDHLTLRTFFTDHKLTAADLAIYGALQGNAAALGSIKKSTFVNLGRWHRHVSSLSFISSALEEIVKQNAAAKSAAKAAKTASGNEKKQASTANFEIGLQDAKEGQVVTRFPPEPSGYLHIGHAKAAMLNQFFAEKYKGKLLIRFDDTNPSKEKQEYQDSIIEDLAMLGISAENLSYTSDHFQTLYDYAVQLIKQGDAYVDDTTQEVMRQQRMDGEPSKRRERSVEESLQLFTGEMKNATEIGQQNCLRAKMSFDNANKAMRDPVIYRVNLQPHHRTGDAWHIYPTYDFCCPIVDSIEGVTHALRTMEYRDRNPQYEWFLHKLNLRFVHIWDFSRMNFVRTLLSKRKLQWFVDQKLVGGWDDARFPTVRGVRRRGMQVPALKEFILSQGPSRNINNLDWFGIWSMNKKVIDPIAPRHVAIVDPIKIKLSGVDKSYSEKRPKHKKNPEVGEKDTYFSAEIVLDRDDVNSFDADEEVTLMDWGNAFVRKAADGTVSMDLHLEGDFKKTSKKVTWLSTTPGPQEVELVDFDYLITKEKLEEGDDVKDFLTPQTEFRTPAIADINVRELRKGDVIQFERKGYYVVDEPFTEGKLIVLFNIPDGKAVSRYGVKPTDTK